MKERHAPKAIIWVLRCSSYPTELTRPRGFKLEYSLKLKIKRNDLLLVDTCPQGRIIAFYFAFENRIEQDRTKIL